MEIVYIGRYLWRRKLVYMSNGGKSCCIYLVYVWGIYVWMHRYVWMCVVIYSYHYLYIGMYGPAWLQLVDNGIYIRIVLVIFLKWLVRVRIMLCIFISLLCEG